MFSSVSAPCSEPFEVPRLPISRQGSREAMPVQTTPLFGSMPSVPVEIALMILRRVSPTTLLYIVSRVSKTFRRFLERDDLWREVVLYHWPDIFCKVESTKTEPCVGIWKRAAVQQITLQHSQRHASFSCEFIKLRQMLVKTIYTQTGVSNRLYTVYVVNYRQGPPTTHMEERMIDDRPALNPERISFYVTSEQPCLTFWRSESGALFMVKERLIEIYQNDPKDEKNLLFRFHLDAKITTASFKPLSRTLVVILTDTNKAYIFNTKTNQHTATLRTNSQLVDVAFRGDMIYFVGKQGDLYAWEYNEQHIEGRKKNVPVWDSPEWQIEPKSIRHAFTGTQIKSLQVQGSQLFLNDEQRGLASISPGNGEFTFTIPAEWAGMKAYHLGPRGVFIYTADKGIRWYSYLDGAPIREDFEPLAYIFKDNLKLATGEDRILSISELWVDGDILFGRTADGHAVVSWNVLTGKAFGFIDVVQGDTHNTFCYHEGKIYVYLRSHFKLLVYNPNMRLLSSRYFPLTS